MNISFLYGSIYNGGAERAITALANDFVMRGDTVSIITLDNGRCGYTLSNAIKLYPLDIMHASQNIAQGISHCWKEIRALKKTIKKIRPDVLFAFDGKLGFYTLLASFGMGIPVIGAERSNPYVARQGRKEKVFVKLSVLLNGFVFETNGAMRFYPDRTQKKSIVIPNAVFSQISAVPPSFEERDKYSLIATGRLDRLKRYDTMIEAMVKVTEQYPEAILDIFGTGNYGNEIAALIRKHDMEKHIRLRGRVTNIPDELINHQVFLLASEHEGMPNGLIEAMAAGCVCVSTDCNFGPAEFIEDGKNGFLIPIGDSDSMAARIMDSFSNWDKAASLGQEAKKLRDRLSMEVIAEKYHAYIEEKCQ